VDSLNLAGLDRVIAVFAAGDTEASLLIRQYRLRLKKGASPKVRPAKRARSAQRDPVPNRATLTCIAPNAQL
jgi:hypothetical protein